VTLSVTLSVTLLTPQQHAAAEACTQRLAAGRGTGIGLQHVNDDQSAQHDKPKRV